MSSKLKDLVKVSVKEYLEANEMTMKDAVRARLQVKYRAFSQKKDLMKKAKVSKS